MCRCHAPASQPPPPAVRPCLWQSSDSYCPQPRHVFHAHACLFALAIKSCACRAPPKRNPPYPPPSTLLPFCAPGGVSRIHCAPYFFSTFRSWYFTLVFSQFGFISLRFLFIFRHSQVQQFSHSPAPAPPWGNSS